MGWSFRRRNDLFKRKSPITMRYFCLLVLLVCSSTLVAETDTLLNLTLPWENMPTSEQGQLLEKGQQQYTEGDLDGALATYQQLLMGLLPDFDDPDPLAHPEESSLYAYPLLVETLARKAAVFEEKNPPNSRSSEMLEQALTCRELIVETIFHLRQTYYQLSFDVQQPDRQQEQLAIQLAYDLYEKTNNPSFLLRCFRLVEKRKKGLLQEALTNPQSFQWGNAPLDQFAALSEQKKQLGQQKAAWARAVSGASPAETTKGLEDNYHQVRKAFNKAKEEFRQQFPRLYPWRYDESVITVGEIQNRLTSTDQVLLSYFITPQHLYAFVVAQSGIRAQKIDRPAQLDQQIRQFHQLLKSGTEEKNGNCSGYDELALQLYQSLIQPFEPLKEEIVIVPDGLIGYVPFNALLYAAPTASCDFATYPFLANKYRVSLHYSSEVFAKAAYAKTNNQSNWLVAIGSGEQEYVQKLVRQSGGKLLSDGGLTSSQFATALEESPLLLIGSLSKSYNGPQRQQSKWPWQETNGASWGTLYGAPTNSPLVVLTECEVEVPNQPQGDQIHCLARSLLHNGAKCVLTSLWPTDGPHLSGFFKAINKGKAKDAALRQNNLQFLSKKSSNAQAAPSHWAGYTLIGDADPIRERNWYWWLLALIPVGGLLYFLRKRQIAKAKKKKEISSVMEY